VEYVKRDASGASGTSLRTVVFQNQAKTLYGLRLIHWTFWNADMAQTNEFMLSALSVRREDQVEDTTTIGQAAMFNEQGFFGLFAVTGDRIGTEGAMAVVGSHDINFPEPYDVPFLAAVFDLFWGTLTHVAVEIWYDRRKVSAAEQARAVAQSGGLVRTS